MFLEIEGSAKGSGDLPCISCCVRISVENGVGPRKYQNFEILIVCWKLSLLENCPAKPETKN